MEKYKEYMDKALTSYYPDEEFMETCGTVPKFRYDTFNYCWEMFRKRKFKTIVELGTSRSFVDGSQPGCNLDDPSYWKPDDCSVWDWGAGVFTRVFAEVTKDTDIQIKTVDITSAHINRCKIMTEEFKNIEYFVMSSLTFLSEVNHKIDLLYMDTGDAYPVEPTANLHLEEAKIVVERNLIPKNGIILIDDVKCPVSRRHDESNQWGKAKYSIPYLLDNGFEMVMDEYQVVLEKR